MRKTLDIAEIDSKATVAFGKSTRLDRVALSPNNHILVADAGLMIFTQIRPGLYDVSLGAEQLGAAAKSMINDGFAWLFINTDAMVVRGTIAASNKACLAMVPHTLGYRLDDHGDVKLYTATLSRWARAYGLKSALSALREAGQGAKADKLQAAAGEV